MKQIRKIFIAINILICCLSAQAIQSGKAKENNGIIISVLPYTLAPYDIQQLSDTINAKMSYLHNHWKQEENPISPDAYVFRVYISNPDSIILTISDSKGDLISEPYRKYFTNGYYSVKVDYYNFPQTGIYFLTAKFCDSSFTRKMYFIK